MVLNFQTSMSPTRFSDILTGQMYYFRRVMITFRNHLITLLSTNMSFIKCFEFVNFFSVQWSLHVLHRARKYSTASLSDDTEAEIIQAFNSASRYPDINDTSNIDNFYL